MREKEKVMTPEKVLEVIALYRELFFKMGIKNENYPHDELLLQENVGLSHCYGMLDAMVRFVKDGRMEKAFR